MEEGPAPEGEQLPWTQPQWLETANNWVQQELQRLGYQIAGSISQPHIRPWSTVLQVPTDQGNVYFKATTPSLAHEPALTAALARWRPDLIPPPLSIDRQRGWMLAPDFEVTLRSQIDSPADFHHWEQILPLLAEVQMEMAGRTEELLALGALDRRLSVLPQRYQDLLADTGNLQIDQPDSLTTLMYQRLQALAPQVEAMAEELAGLGIPESLHHEDFHDANIFVRQGRYIFSDWGESGVSHPFATMLVTLRSIAYRMELEDDAPQVTRLRDVYLESWTAYASRAELLRAFELAYSLGMICRSLTWRRVVAPLPEPHRSEHIAAVPGWLEAFHERMTPVQSRSPL